MQSIARQSAQIIRRSAVAGSARAVSTQSLSPEDGYAYLNKQRALRPSSPWHIYQPQLTSGTGLSVVFYALFLAHVGAPLAGVELDSETMVDAFHNLPTWLQWSGKSLIAGPAAYHSINGLRHLGWDMGYFLQLKSSYMAGYAVLGSTAIATAGLLAL